MTQMIIELKNIYKSYNSDTPVLKDIDLKIPEGSFITIVGPSGCGKTTLLRLINRMILPDRGLLKIKGKDINEWNEIELRRSTGYVIQNGGLFPHLNIQRNMEFVLSISHREKDEREKRVKELCELIGFDQSRLNAFPDELSGGQQQRIGVARALAANPDLVLMDEPFGALDNITRKKLQKELKEMHKSLGITFIFITHDINEAFNLGNKVVIMNEGRIEQYDSPANIRRNPANEWVQEFIE